MRFVEFKCLILVYIYFFLALGSFIGAATLGIDNHVGKSYAEGSTFLISHGLELSVFVFWSIKFKFNTFFLEMYNIILIKIVENRT